MLDPSEQGSSFWDDWLEGSHAYVYSRKWTFSHLCPSKSPEMCVETISIGLVFLRRSIWGVTCLWFTWKMNVFPIYLLKNTRNVCWIHQNRARFSEMIDLRAHMPRFTSRNEHFPIYLLKNARNVCWIHQNRVRLSEMIDLRGHILMCTQKMNVFPSISLESPQMCVEILST